MPLELILIIIFCAAVFHAWGVWEAVGKLRATIAVEKLARSYGLDYTIKNKTWMYVICIVFSWLAYSAFVKLHK